MSFPQVTIEGLALLFFGSLLGILSPSVVLIPARRLRSWIWTIVILLGEKVAIPLSVLSILIALLAALPTFSALVSSENAATIQNFSSTQLVLSGCSLFARCVLWPAIALDWSRVRRWEQEVVRRPRGRRGFLYFRFGRPRLAKNLVARASILGSQLAEIDLKNSKSFLTIPHQSFGLLMVYVASLELLKRPPPMLTDLIRFSLLAAISLLLARDIAALLRAQPRPGVEVGFAPVDRKYSFLKRMTQIAQWLAKPRHLVFLLIQIDILQTTLKLALRW